MAKKLPETFLYKDDDGNVQSQPFAAFISNVVKGKKVKGLKDENGDEVQNPQDIVKSLFKAHLNDEEGAFELPEELESYQNLSEFIREQVDIHIEATAFEKEQKDSEKAAKAQEKEQKKAEKEASDKAYAESQEAFEMRIVNAAEKHSKRAQQQFSDSVASVKSNLPKTIGFAGEGMGLVIADGVSKDDLAQATSAIIGGLEGVTNAQSALQFSLGDVVNASIANKIFRTKNEAQEHVRVILFDKLGKKFSIGAINFYALMSERIPIDKRKPGIAPSIYLEASKIVAPRIKEGSKQENEELAKKFDDARAEMIDEIANGNISSIKEVKDRVKQFKGEVGLLKGDTIGVAELSRRLFFALWIKENLEHTEGEYTFKASKESDETVKIPVGHVTDYITQALNELQNIHLSGYDVAALLRGNVTKGKGDKQETVPYLLANPFVTKE